MTQNENLAYWRSKFQRLLANCQQELKRTTEIGKQMISAGQSNSMLKENYEDLGRLVHQLLKEDAIQTDHQKIHAAIKEIEELEIIIEEHEKELNKIKTEGPRTP